MVRSRLMLWFVNKFIDKMNQVQYSKAREPLGSRVNLDFTPKKSNCSWTDQRIEEIKKKYDSNSKPTISSELKIRVKTQAYEKQNDNKLYKTQYNHQAPYNSNTQPPHTHIYTRTKTYQHFDSGLKPSGQQSYISPQGSNVKSKAEQSIGLLEGSINYQHKLPSYNEKPPKIASIRLNTEYSALSRSRDPMSKLNRRQVYDSRMQNIDKINSKIKQILNSIQSCQQQSRFAQIQLSRNRQIDQSYLKKSIISHNDIKEQPGVNEFEETKILQKKKFYYKNDCNEEFGDGNKQEIKREIIFPDYSGKKNQFEDYLNSYSNKLKEQEKEIQSRKNALKDRELMRSSSCFSRIKKDSASVNHQSIIMEDNIEHIDKEINRFHKKIEALEEQKRKMNIEFKPFDFDYSPAKKIDRNYTPDSFKKVKKYDYNRQEANRSVFLQQLEPKSSKTINYDNSSHQRSKTASCFYPKQTVSSFIDEGQTKIDKPQLKEEKDIKESIIHQEGLGKQEEELEKEDEVYDNWELRKNVGERMEERRKMLQQFQNEKGSGKTQRKETQRLIQALCKQVALDEELRNSKNWFAESHASSKVNLLRQELSKKGVSMTMDQIERQFNTVNDDENDPFFSFREEKYSISSVVDHYVEASSFWKENLLHSWDFSQLLGQEHFAQKFINKKDIAIEDMVRLLNTETGNFYRNRDLYLIFDRIKRQLKSQSNEKITVDQLKMVLGK